MQFRVLGPLEVRDGDSSLPLGGHRQRLVLAVLILYAGRALSTDYLIDAVWGDEPPGTARKTLQVYVSRLRRLLGPVVIEATPNGYLLRVVPGDVDSQRFEELAVQGQGLLASDPAAAARVLRRALGLWRGTPWGELGDEPAIQAEAQRLRESRLVALENRITADLESGSARGLVGELEGLVEEHPLREGFRLQLMKAFYWSDRQAEALQVFQESRKVLGEELGIVPSKALQDLEEQMLLQDPAIDGPPPVPVEDWGLARNPYKGLRAFEEADAERFFGRAELIEALVAAIGHHPLVAVVGASGSGKSSVVRGGVLPRVRIESAGWVVAAMRPGSHPFAEFRVAVRGLVSGGTKHAAGEERGGDLEILRTVQEILPEGAATMLLVIDQFEELFHQAIDQRERSRFIRNLIEAAEDPHSRLTVLVTLRADFLDRAFAEPVLGALINQGMVAVLPLTPTELESAAARPAERVGVSLEPELIAELVSDMTDQPGALPLFQYVLTRVFAERAGPVLTRSTYRRLGGLRGALARRAEEVYQMLDAARQEAARQLLLRLVIIGDDGHISRRRVERAELDALGIDPGAVKIALDSFDQARLLSFDRSPVTGRATVEVAHEALLKEWPRLRGWLEEASDDLRLQRALETEVAQWESSGRDPDFLLAGSRLGQHESRGEGSIIELTKAENDFLAASIARRDAEQAAEEERRQQELLVERRAVRRLRWLVGVVSIAALITSAVTVFAVGQRRDAVTSQREARSRELANASLTNLESDPEIAVLLALESIDVTRSADGTVLREAEEALHLAVNTHRLVGEAQGEYSVAFHPDGSLFVGGERPQLIDPTTGTVLVELPPHPAGWLRQSVAVSNDGGLVATGTDHGGDLVVWDATTGAEIIELAGPVDSIGPIAFSRDDRLLAALAPGGGGVFVWDLATGDRVAQAHDPQAWDACCPPAEIVFSGDGDVVAVTTFSGETFLAGEVKMLDVASSEWIMTLRGHDGPVSGVEYLPDNTTIVTGSMDGTIRVWDVTTGATLSSFDAGVGQVMSLDVSSDGEMLLVGGDRGTLKLWALVEGGARLVTTLSGHRSLVLGVDLGGSGDLGASIDIGGSVLVWDVSPTGPGEVAAWSAGRPVAFTADGSRIATTGPAGRDVVIRSTTDWSTEVVLEDAAPYVGLPGEEWGSVVGIALSPQGDRLVSTSGSRRESVNGSVTLWDVAVGEPIQTLLEHPFLKGPVAFSGDGGRVAASACGLPGASASVWDSDSGDLVLSVPTTSCGHGVDLDFTGRLLAVQTAAEDEPNVQIWDTEVGELVGAVTHMPQWVGVVEFSPDGTRLLTGGGDGTARIWDVANWDLVRTLTGHVGGVESATWSSDGTTIVTGSYDGTVRLWDADNGTTRLILGGHDTFPFVAISPDGRYLATATDIGVRVWALGVDELIGIASQRVPRSLTPAECIAYHFEECPSAP